MVLGYVVAAVVLLAVMCRIAWGPRAEHCPTPGESLHQGGVINHACFDAPRAFVDLRERDASGAAMGSYKWFSKRACVSQKVMSAMTLRHFIAIAHEVHMGTSSSQGP